MFLLFQVCVCMFTLSVFLFVCCWFFVCLFVGGGGGGGFGGGVFICHWSVRRLSRAT